jgi:hypothetical protein
LKSESWPRDNDLTASQCHELAEALFEEAAVLREEPKKAKLLQLAQSYYYLAELSFLSRARRTDRASRRPNASTAGFQALDLRIYA